MPRGVFFRDLPRGALELLPQLIETLAGGRAHRHNRRPFEERAGHKFLRFEAGQLQDVPIHQVGLGEHHDPPRNAQQTADIEVLAGLRLDGFLGRDHE